MEKQFVVLGLGIFGSTLVKTLSQFGREVIAIDKDSENVQRVSEFATKAVIGDVTDIQFLTDLGLDDIDVGIVAIGDRLEDSILATMNLKELGVPYVIVKAKNKRFKVVLERIGADHVVRPEKEMGEKIARTLLRKNIKDLIELDEENCIVEMKVPQSWIGKSLSQLDLRKLYSINILGKRDPKTHKLEVPVDPSAPIEMNDTFLVLGQTDKIEKYDYLL
ncbi:potassium channel family protein [Faecalibacillus faecis]|uniref:potassium channel family protein n=1 Tax=Faecalibacillus faecis TaxID=1982628 RepID=UPI0018AA4008|nr:TrkA family potassium uptake protein [Faecalibacillus faecis]